MFYYSVYNTIIASEIPILNLPTTNESAAIADIILSDEPSTHIPDKILGTYYSPKLAALGMSCGTMEISDGKLIKIHLYDGYTPAEVGPFIIGWGFGFLFFQRDYTIFHCSALNIGGKGVLVSGVSGAGKSTTALSLIKNGARYLADDMAILKPTESFDIQPAYPIQKVCRDVSTGLNPEELMHINEGRDKFSYHNETDYCDTPVRITHLILLKIDDGDKVVTKEYKGIDSWMRVLECMYLNELFAAFGTPDKDKFNCLKIAEVIKVIEITRPRGKDTLDEITSIINDYVNQ